jgi:hypothetical protein
MVDCPFPPLSTGGQVKPKPILETISQLQTFFRMTVPKLLNILVHTLQLFLAIWQGLHSFSTWALSESIHLPGRWCFLDEFGKHHWRSCHHFYG